SIRWMLPGLRSQDSGPGRAACGPGGGQRMPPARIELAGQITVQIGHPQTVTPIAIRREYEVTAVGGPAGILVVATGDGRLGAGAVGATGPHVEAAADARYERQAVALRR